MQQRAIAIIGGDARQAYAVRAFLRAGWQVRQYQVPQLPGVDQGEQYDSLTEALSGVEIVLGPVPFKGMDPMEFRQGLQPGQTFFGGMLPPELTAFCEAHEIDCIDLLERDDIAILNAISTAEGAIAEAIAASGANLHLSFALVLGYGRCAKPLVKKLQGMGAHVTVAARRWEPACAALADGCEVLDFQLMPYQLPRFHFIFNTVPAMVLPAPLLETVAEDTVIIDIASAPGGVDFAAAEALGLCAKLSLSLPGKYSPRATGESIAQITRIILEEREGSAWGSWNWNTPGPASA